MSHINFSILVLLVSVIIILDTVTRAFAEEK